MTRFNVWFWIGVVVLILLVLELLGVTDVVSGIDSLID
jgi:hypothetical protein